VRDPVADQLFVVGLHRHVGVANRPAENLGKDRGHLGERKGLGPRKRVDAIIVFTAGKYGRGNHRQVAPIDEGKTSVPERPAKQIIRLDGGGNPKQVLHEKLRP